MDNKKIVIRPGQLIFIKDRFLQKYFPAKNGNYINHGKGRPFFYILSEDKNFLWVVPLSSDKEGKLTKKMNEYKNKESKGNPSWYASAKVLGAQKIFKLSGMFPVPKEEVDHIFVNRKNPDVPPITEKVQTAMIEKCKAYYKQNFENIKQGRSRLITSPYEKILQDYKRREIESPELEEENEFEIE